MVGTDVLLVDVLKVAINAHRESLPAAVKGRDRAGSNKSVPFLASGPQ